MTEFEIATLTLQQSTLALQESTLALQERVLAFQENTLALQERALALQERGLALQGSGLALQEGAVWVAVAQVAATIVIGLGQIAIVWFGIRVMQRTGAQRAREQDQRHEEAMNALRELIVRTATPRAG